MKILLTGKDGQVGFELRRALAVLGDVVAVGRADCDLADPAAVRRLVRQTTPDVIVNPAAYTAVDRAEQDAELAFAINARAPQALAEEAAQAGAWLVHYSTDYVFDGRQSTPYTEADPPCPQGVYGASKLAGETAIGGSGARHLILRTSWVAGVHGGNFAKTMLRLAAERQTLRVVADQYGAPTSAALVADVTAHLIRAVAAGASTHSASSGIYHLSASGCTDWHAYACHVIERARAAGWPITVARESIHAITTADYPTPATRPAHSRLDTGKLRRTFGLHLPHWRDGVDHVLDQLLSKPSA